MTETETKTVDTTKLAQLNDTRDSFQKLGLSNWLATNLTNVGFDKPTEIQQDSIPAALTGHNVIGCAHTGSGKTACFALPVIERLSKDPYGIFALVMTPTRELAFQISEQFNAFSAGNLNLKCCTIVGGVDMMRQAQELQEIPHVIVATPGRLSQLLELDQSNLNEYLDNLQFLILDEADRMLTDPTIENHMRQVLDAINARQEKRRQTLLFSATIAKDYTQLYTKEQIFGKFIDPKLDFDICEFGNAENADATFKKTVANLEQKFAIIPANIKEAHLIQLLNTTKLKKQQQMIIFTSTCRSCHFLAMLCQEFDFKVALIHSQLSQRKRIANLAKFKSQHVQILIATDVASRGLDISKVQIVLNYDVPRSPKDYVHRVGRTARAGRGGTSMTFVTQYDVKLILACEIYIGQKLTKVELDEKAALSDFSHLHKVMNIVRIKMSEQGITDMFDEYEVNKKRDRKAIQKKAEKDEQKESK